MSPKNTMPSPFAIMEEGSNIMAPKKKNIGPRRKKYNEGGYDPILRAIPLFFAIPTLAFFAVDLNRYMEHSALHDVQHRPHLIIDAIALSVVALMIVWDLLYITISRYSTLPSVPLAAMDFLFAIAAASLSDVTFSERTSNNSCIQLLGECSASAQSIMQAAGGLLVVVSIPHHALWGIACGRWFKRFRQRRKERKTAAATDTEAGAADPEVISFWNGFLPKESETSMDAVITEPDPVPFSNEIK